jgi:epoxyqueuosine reductase
LTVTDESEALRVQDIEGFPTSPGMVFGALTEAHSSWVPKGPWRGAIVWGLPLPDDVVDELTTGPTPRYARAYEEWNYRLDVLACEAEGRLAAMGIQARAIAASRVVDEKRQRGEASHRHLAASLGMGWIGRHGLLVTLKWGPALRLVTVLVDRPIAPSPKLSFVGCGACWECVDACPVGALDPPISPETLTRCSKLLEKYRRNPDIGHLICGVCLKACRDAIRNQQNDDSGNL